MRLSNREPVLELLDWCLNLSGIGHFVCLAVLADITEIMLRFVIHRNRKLELRSMFAFSLALGPLTHQMKHDLIPL